MENKFYYAPEIMFMSFDARDVIAASEIGGGNSGSDTDELPDMEPDD